MDQYNLQNQTTDPFGSSYYEAAPTV
jgi:hypothetical protein